MKHILVVGAGKIGLLVATLLASHKTYCVHIADKRVDGPELYALKKKISKLNLFQVDVMESSSKSSIAHYIEANGIQAVVACVPYFCSFSIAKIAKAQQVHYFDILEDTKVSEKIRHLALDARSAFVLQCGLAPGLVSIIAQDLMRRFEQVDSVWMRVGALPRYPHNALKYALTWSTEGLINEYGNPCFAIVDGKRVVLPPLEGLESIQLDGLSYEAFNTSGGLGTLADTYEGQVRMMNYKTLRYPGHCEKMRFLMNALELNQKRSLLKQILEGALAHTMQDVVIVYVAVQGDRQGQRQGVWHEETYVKKIYPQRIGGTLWTAIQVSTAASICAVVDIILKKTPIPFGNVKQESILLSELMGNPFGQYIYSNRQEE